MKKNTIIITLIAAVLGGVFYEYKNNPPINASNVELIQDVNKKLVAVHEYGEKKSEKKVILTTENLEIYDITKKIDKEISTFSLKTKPLIFKENNMINEGGLNLEHPTPDGWTLRETLTGVGEDSFFKTVEGFLESDVMSREHEGITPASYVKINIDSILKLSVGDAYFLPEINGIQHKVFITKINDNYEPLVIIGDIEGHDWDEAVTLHYHIDNDEVAIYITTPDGEFQLLTIEGKGTIHSNRILNEEYDKIFKEEEIQDSEYTQWLNEHRKEPENRDISI